jgi:hypothetical protein
MSSPFLLSRVLLQFDSNSSDIVNDLSATAITPDGYLWVGSDEGRALERLTPIEPFVFGEHKQFHMGDFFPLADGESEIDIEGMDFSSPYLWITGSHSWKRKKPKGKKDDLERLATIKLDANRYLLGRIPIESGKLKKSVTLDGSDTPFTAACLQTTDDSNLLIEALEEDEHLGVIVTSQLPSKENGLDIEGLAVWKNRLFLGLRGPVLRGWAVILELEVEENEPGSLALKAIGDKQESYRKHFVDLNGLGVRDLCFDDEDLIVLAGPTMETESALQVFRLRGILDRNAHSLFSQDSKNLDLLFNLPFIFGADHAEGIELYSCLGHLGLFMVYDSPDPSRLIEGDSVYADIFRLR